jgi:hypothetical protein
MVCIDYFYAMHSVVYIDTDLKWIRFDYVFTNITQYFYCYSTYTPDDGNTEPEHVAFSIIN